MSSTRRARRDAQLAARRERRRGRQPARRQLPIVALSIAGLALGAVAVLVFAFVLSPPAGEVDDLNAPLLPAPYGLADGNALGSADAPLTVEVWSDYQCPACATFATSYQPRLIADYVGGGRVRLVHRDFTILGQESTDAAIAAGCAEQQGHYWQFHDYLFANQAGRNSGAFSPARLEAMAQVVGLEMEQYRACRADPQVRQAVSTDLDEGRAQGVTSTPTLIIGDQLLAGVPSSYEQLAAVIEQALAEAATGR